MLGVSSTERVPLDVLRELLFVGVGPLVGVVQLPVRVVVRGRRLGASAAEAAHDAEVVVVEVREPGRVLREE